MRKKDIILLSVVLVFFLVTDITTLAAGIECPYCSVILKSHGEHMWHTAINHIGNDGQECTYTISEDKGWWECPNGHGIICTRIHHKETHSNGSCKNLDYYY